MTNFKYNDEFETDILGAKHRYYYKSDHRDGTREKSQWTIKPLEELEIFKNSHVKKWKSEFRSWGLKVENEIKLDLGLNKEKIKLSVAVFVDSFKKNTWHGYPADFKRDKTDIPNAPILAEWKAKGYTTKSKISQAMQGKICTL